MRVQINLEDDMVRRLDKIAKGYGVSRSALGSMFIGQMVNSTEKGVEFAKTLSQDEGFLRNIITSMSEENK